VVGIAASKIAEKFWRPTWLFELGEEWCKGSARSIPGFDVTEAMANVGANFERFGGHRAAGGFTFKRQNLELVKQGLAEYARGIQQAQPDLWRSRIHYDCTIGTHLADLELAHCVESLKPFGHGFEEPRFVIEAEVLGAEFYRDKNTGEAKHTAIMI